MGTRGHINSYNLRQVAPDYNVYSPDYGKLIDVAANTIKTVANNEANQAKLANFQVDLNSKFMQKNYEINTKYQAEPDNPEREKEIKNAFDELANSYKVSPLLKQQWEQTKQKIYNGYVTYNSDWMLKQNVQNAQTNLETGRKNLLQNGYNLAASGADDGLIQLTYANGLDAIKKGSIHWLGEQTVNQALKDIHSDYAKCVLNGLTEYDPVQAYKILNTAPAYDNMNKYKKSIKPADYDTKLSPDEEKKFQEWVKKYKDKGIISPDEDFHDYDMRGFYKEFGKNWDDGVNEDAHAEMSGKAAPAESDNGLPRRSAPRNDGDSNGDADSLEGGGVNSTDGKYHFPDKYKKPNHQTFSNESMYCNEKNAQYAGSWNEDGTFNPPDNPNVHPLINDLNDESAREELLSVAEKKMFQLNEKNAVQQLVGTFKDMNSEQYNNILNGNANYGEVKQFIESHPKLPKKSKEIIGDIYGIKMKSSYYIDDVTGKVKKIDEDTGSSGYGRGGGGRGSYGRGSYGSESAYDYGVNDIIHLPKNEKENLKVNLINTLADLVSFNKDDIPKTDAKKLKNDERTKKQGYVRSALNSLIAIQGSIDTLYKGKCITAKERDSYMNRRLAPFVEYLEKNLKTFDESSGFLKRDSLGYGKIKKEFDYSNVAKGEGRAERIRELKRDLLTAQTCYFDTLEKAAQKLGFTSIYDLENMPAEGQRKIYDIAAANAINTAKKYSNRPEMYFANQYPALYNQALEILDRKGGQLAARQAAKQIYGNNITKPEEIKKELSTACNSVYMYKYNKNMRKLVDNYRLVTMPKPQEFNYFADKNVKHPLVRTAQKAWDMLENTALYFGDKQTNYNQTLKKKQKALGISDKTLEEFMKKYKVDKGKALSLMEAEKAASEGRLGDMLYGY